MTTAAPRTRKTAAKTPPPPALGGPEPIELSGEKPQEELVPAFTIDGKTYMMRTRPRANVMLKALWQMKTEGMGMAQVTLLEKVLTPEAFTALMEYDDLSPEQYAQIVDLVTNVALGNLEELQGN